MGISFIHLKEYEESDFILYFWSVIHRKIYSEHFKIDEETFNNYKKLILGDIKIDKGLFLSY